MNSPRGPEGGPNDDSIQRGLLGSDVEMLRALYKRESPTIYALCLRMLRDAQRAEEVMQDVFWQIWSHPEKFDPERGRLRTFLTQMARSRCLDRLRAERSQTRRIQAASTELAPMSNATTESTPLDQAIGAEERQRVRTALDALAPDFREVVILTYFEGLSQSEIATRIKSPLGTVKTRVRRGLLQLRKNLHASGVAS